MSHNTSQPPVLARMSRAEKAELAGRLYVAGRTHQEIADSLGLSRSYVASLVIDPEGKKERARKDRYRGVCWRCGKPTTGCDGPNHAPKLCIACDRSRKKEELTIWTQDVIIQKLREWADTHDGDPPKAADWQSGHAGEWPSTSAVQKRFGSWSNGLEAAGFERRLPFMCTPEWKTMRMQWQK